MKNFKILFLFLSLILIFEITASKEANAAACTVTNGVYSETEIKSGCEATPDFYEIVINDKNKIKYLKFFILKSSCFYSESF